MHLVTLNAAGKPLAPVRALDPRRRRLSQVIGRHVDRARPHMIAVQRARDPLQPIEEAWVLRGRDRAGKVKPWPRMFLPADAIVVVVYLPRGGGGAGGRSSGKGIGSIALSIAAVALIAFAGPISGALLPTLVLGAVPAAILQAGLVLGGSALLSLASRAKANKQATDTTKIYGVAGGGNQPKPGDRIPRGYGRSWMKPDLSQPDFSQYDGDDQILFKRHTLGLGKYRPYRVRVGKQVVWSEDGGFLAPFDDARNAIEFVHGEPSELVPSNVISATGIGGLLPRPEDHPTYAGPFLINQRGALVSRLQVDFQFPQGISRVQFFKSGSSQSNLPAAWSVMFEFAPIDETGAEIGPWQELYYGNSGAEGARFATHPLRYTRFKDVPPGRYAVRGWNVQPDTSQATSGNASIDACQWDGASGWVADTAIRDGITEMAMRIYATKATQAAAFGEVEVDAAAILPVWTGSAWEEQETSKAVWAFLDIMRNPDYGGALPDDQIDVETARAYAARLGEFDTFDGTIRGPVSVYEAAATVLLPLRAEPVHLGRWWSFVRDEPKAVRRHVVTRGQILKGTTQVVFDLDSASGAGHVIGEFDQDGDYRNPNQTTAIYGEASLTPTRQRWTGVRSYAHAEHLTRWRAASGAYRRRSAPFGVEMEGRIYKRGDSIAIDQWFVDTRRKANVVLSDGNTLFLDADIVVAPGDATVLRDRTGREWGPVHIGQGVDARQIVLDPNERAAVEARTGVSLAQCLSDGRGEMTPVLVGPVEVLRENYLIQSVKPSGPDRAQVYALIDDPRVWAAIGAEPTVPPDGGGGLQDPVTPRVIGLTANAVQIAAGWRCDFAIQPGRGAMSFEVGLSYDGGSHYETIYTGTATTGSHVLNPVDPTEVRLRARAFGSTGLPGVYFYAALPLAESKIAGSLLTDLEEQFEQVGLDFKALQALIDDLAKQANQTIADALKQAVSQQKQLAEAVARLRGEVQTIAEAAATVEGTNYDSRQLLKAALEGRTQDAFAAIQEEKTLRVSGDETLARTTTTLATRLGTAESAIQTETLARTTADETQAGQITTAYSRLTAAELSLTGLASAQQGLITRVTTAEGSITSLSQQFVTLNSQLKDANDRITANGSAITSLQTLTTSINGTLTTQSQQITALNGSIIDVNKGVIANAEATSVLSSRVTSAEGRITTQSDQITRLNNSITDVNGAVVGNAAALNSLSTSVTAIQTDTGNLNRVVGAQATSLQQLTTTVGGNTATLNTVASSVNGIKLSFGVLGTINGQTGGFQLLGAAKLDGTVSYNLEILGDLIATGSITGRSLAAQNLITASAQIGNLVVDNLQINDGAVSQSYAAYSSDRTTSIPITVRRASSRLFVLALFDGRSNVGSTLGPGDFLIYRDGNLIRQVPAAFALFKPDSGNLQFYLTSMAVGVIDAPGVGSHSYQITHSNGQGVGGVYLIVTELSK